MPDILILSDDASLEVRLQHRLAEFGYSTQCHRAADSPMVPYPRSRAILFVLPAIGSILLRSDDSTERRAVRLLADRIRRDVPIGFVYCAPTSHAETEDASAILLHFREGSQRLHSDLIRLAGREIAVFAWLFSLSTGETEFGAELSRDLASWLKNHGIEPSLSRGEREHELARLRGQLEELRRKARPQLRQLRAPGNTKLFASAGPSRMAPEGLLRHATLDPVCRSPLPPGVFREEGALWRMLRRLTFGLLQPQFDRVEASVFAPECVSAGTRFLIQVFAHCLHLHEQEQARRLAAEYDRATGRRGRKCLGTEIARGTRLAFQLKLPGFGVEEPVQTLLWQGRTDCVQFDVTAPEDLGQEGVVATVIVSCQGVPLGHIKFNLAVAERGGSEVSRPQPMGSDARWYGLAFVSYAAEDRTEVLKRVQMLHALGIRFFQDVLSLKPGDRWQQRLYQHIDECDVFFLFWTSAAKTSRWVIKEALYALERKGDDESRPPEIIPVILEGPPPVAPPKELAHLHFDDSLLYLMGDR